MGFKKETLSAQSRIKTNKTNLQNYYSSLYQSSTKQLLQQGHQQTQIDKTLLSIFSRTKIPTKTTSNRLLKLLDIDKIISINERSLKENSEQIKHMRMIASIKHSTQTSRQQQQTPTHINELVRLARMHLLQQTNRNTPQVDSQDQQTNQINPRLQRLRQIRLERLRNNPRTTVNQIIHEDHSTVNQLVREDHSNNHEM